MTSSARVRAVSHHPGERLVRVLPALLGVAAVLAGLAWWWVPAAYPYGPADPVTVGVNHLLPRGTASGLLLAAGGLGLVVAGLGRASGRVRWVAGIGAVLLAVFFAVVLSDASVMSVLGYVVAVGAPFGLMALVVLACVTRPRVGLVLAAGLVAGVAVAAGTGVLRAFVVYWATFVAALGVYGGHVVWSLAMAGTAAAWAGVAAHLLSPRAAGAGEGIPGRRWGTVVTVVAAGCPLPYGLVRLTWLTPWAIGVAPAYDGLAVRVQGASLGVAAVLGCVLTLGLISGWGETFPRWVPAVGGRPVPVALAVVPGSVVAAALLVAAPGIVVSAFQDAPRDAVLGLLLFPYPLWGPALAAAVVAYRWRRLAPRTVGGCRDLPTPC